MKVGPATVSCSSFLSSSLSVASWGEEGVHRACSSSISGDEDSSGAEDEDDERTVGPVESLDLLCVSSVCFACSFFFCLNRFHCSFPLASACVHKVREPTLGIAWWRC